MVEQPKPINQKHSIEAFIDGLGNDTILVAYIPLSKMDERGEPIQDIIYSENGYFSYDLPSQESILLYIFPKKGEFIRSNGKAYRPNEKHITVLLKPDDKLEIEGRLEELFIDYKVSGNEFNEHYTKIRKQYIGEKSKAVALELELDRLMASQGKKELIADLFQKRNEITSISRRYHLEYIENNLDKELAAFYLTTQPLEIFGKWYDKLTDDVRHGSFKSALDFKYTNYKKFTKVKAAELQVKEGEVAPSFVLPSLDNSFSLDTVKNKYLILDFWGSWCPPCTSGFPRMKAYYSRYKDNVEFIGINCNESEDKWRIAINKYELPWTQLINSTDINQDVSVMYCVYSFPSKFILDENKKIIGKYVGETDEFYNKLDELMAKN